MRSQVVLAAALAAVAAPAGAGPPERPEEVPVVAGEAGLRLSAAVLKAAGEGFRGAVLVAEGGKVLLAAPFGALDGALDGARTPMPADALFDLASVAKQFTAAAVFRLAERGKLSVDDSVAKHLPKVPADKKAVTLRHLLTHTSGLPPLVPGLGPEDSADRDRFVAKVLAAPLAAKPGKSFVYDNHGYGLLAAVVERTGGRPFEAWMRAEVFGPAGLKDTGFYGDDLDRRRLVARITRMGGEPVVQGDAARWPWDWSLRGAGGVVSSVRDLARWDRALREGKVVGAESVRAMSRPALEGFACGWMVGTLDPRGDAAWVFHTGRISGFQSCLARWLDRDRCVAVLTDEASDPQAVLGALVRALDAK